MTEKPAQQTGGCLCRKIQYAISPSAEPACNVLCHCPSCKKASGSHMACTSIFLKSQFTITSAAQPKAYTDATTESGTPLSRNFCGDCGSPLFVTTPLSESTVSVFTGTMDEEGPLKKSWRPNMEVFVETRSHWLPDFEMLGKEGIVKQKYPRGPTDVEDGGWELS